MALKFLNKKGWHTGSLRNIENVWKAEQKHEAEQKKLEELRKQIQDERERSEFRLLQEQAGLVPRQERLDFLYDSGLAVGKGSSSSKGESGVAFKALEGTLPGTTQPPSSSSSDAKQPSVPGALFEDKPHSANDAWRKLHSDPLLLIRQREKEALARIKNNPVQMAIIRNSVKGSKEKEKDHGKKEHRKKHSHSKTKHRRHSSSHQSDSESDQTREINDQKASKTEKRREIGGHKASKYREHHSKVPMDDADRESSDSGGERRKSSRKASIYREQSPRSFSGRKTAKTDDSKNEKKREIDGHKASRYREHHSKVPMDDVDRESSESGGERRKSSHKASRFREQSPRSFSVSKTAKIDDQNGVGNNDVKSKDDKLSLGGRANTNGNRKERDARSSREARSYGSSDDSHLKRRNVAPKLSEEERAAKLREMQVDAELHEENRWKRLKKADDEDAREATRSSMVSGRNFLDAAHKSVYGTEKGGSSTIEESVRRRAHYSQGWSEAVDRNAFRR